MNIASLELSKELYELSGWGYNFHYYGEGKHDRTERMWRHWQAKRTGSEWWTTLDDYDVMGDCRDPFDGRRPTGITHDVLERVPAYDLGYLLRKLPPVIQDPYDKVFKHLQLWINGDATVHVGYVEPYAHDDKVAYAQHADTPEDAACKLAIELFKQGILTKEQS